MSFTSEPPASPQSIAKLLTRTPGGWLPKAYLHFLEKSDGGYGPISVAPGYVSLASVSTMLTIVDSWEIPDGLFVIGTNGAGELLVFDLRKRSSAVFYVSPADFRYEELRPVAVSFSKFMTLIRNCEPEFRNFEDDLVAINERAAKTEVAEALGCDFWLPNEIEEKNVLFEISRYAPEFVAIGQCPNFHFIGIRKSDSSVWYVHMLGPEHLGPKRLADSMEQLKERVQTLLEEMPELRRWL